MLKYFKRGKQTTRVPRPAIIKLRIYIETRQRQFAHYLQEKLQRLSTRALTMCLMGFCITSSSICAYLLMTAIYPKGLSPVAVASPLNTPLHTTTMDTLFVYPGKKSKNNK